MVIELVEILCSKYREGGKIKTRTEAILSKLPEHIILGLVIEPVEI